MKGIIAGYAYWGNSSARLEYTDAHGLALGGGYRVAECNSING